MKYVTDFNNIKLLRPRRQIHPIIPLVMSTKSNKQNHLKTLRFFSIKELLKPKSPNYIESLTSNDNIKQLIHNCSQLNTHNKTNDNSNIISTIGNNNINKGILRSYSTSTLNPSTYVSTTPKIKLPELITNKYKQQSCKNLFFTKQNITRNNSKNNKYEDDIQHILTKNKPIGLQESKIQIKNFGYFSKLPNLAKSKTNIGNNNKKETPKQEHIDINDMFKNTSNNNTNEDINEQIKLALKRRKRKKKYLSPISADNSLMNFIEPPAPSHRKCTYFIRPNLPTKLLGTISLFCVLNGIGEYGYFICKKLSSFLIDYFSNSTTIPVSYNRDNYYTIISTAFKEANKYLKTLTYIDTSKNGASCLLLYIPSDGSSDIYCANVGNSKCVIMNYQRSSPLSYAHKPELVCELERIQMCGGIVRNSCEIGNVGGNMDVKIINEGKGNDMRVYDGKEGDKGIGLSRVMGMFQYENVGVIAEPEIIGWNIAKEIGRCIVIGTKGLWDWISNEEVGRVVKKFYRNYDAEGAGLAVLEKAMENYRKHGKVGELEEIVGIVVFVSSSR